MMSIFMKLMMLLQIYMIFFACEISHSRMKKNQLTPFKIQQTRCNTFKNYFYVIH